MADSSPRCGTHIKAALHFCWQLIRGAKYQMCYLWGRSRLWLKHLVHTFGLGPPNGYVALYKMFTLKRYKSKAQRPQDTNLNQLLPKTFDMQNDLFHSRNSTDSRSCDNISESHMPRNDVCKDNFIAKYVEVSNRYTRQNILLPEVGIS